MIEQATKVSNEQAAEIERAEQDARQAEERRKLTEQANEAIQKQLTKLAEKAKQADAEARAAAEAKELAERRIIEAKRRIAPPPVTHDVAISSAQKIIEAIATTDTSKAPEVWDAIDDVRCRLMTNEIAEDARSLVLAAESVITACDEWELQRTVRFADHVGEEFFKDGAGETREERLPGQSRLVRIRTEELNHVIAGTTPDAVPETIGKLIAQNVMYPQICRMYGFIHPGGKPKLEQLGAAIDKILEEAGFYREEGTSRWTHLTAMCALTREDAWNMRESGLPTRKARAEARQAQPGEPAVEGDLPRDGREPRPSSAIRAGV